MDLFTPLRDPKDNILPRDGRVHYHGPILSPREADRYFQALMEHVPWERDVAILFGKRIETKRKVAWFADGDYHYTYSNHTKKAHSWIPELLALKALAEAHSGETYNSCLVNLYHNGEEGMAWHSDGEKALKPDAAIASLSLGAPRRFAFKHRASGEKLELVLEHGALLVMKGPTQRHWLHRLPPAKKVRAPRINLTFRAILPQG